MVGPDGGETLVRFHHDTLAVIWNQWQVEREQGQLLPCPRGLLLGPPDTLTGSLISVEGIKPSQGIGTPERIETLRRFARLWHTSSISRLALVGFYRLLPDGQEMVDESEWTLLRELGSSDTILLTVGRTADGKLASRVYRTSSSELLGEIAASQQTLHESTPRTRDVSPGRQTQPFEIVPVPNEGYLRNWKVMLAAGLLLAIVLVAGTGIVRPLLSTARSIPAVPAASRQKPAVAVGLPEDHPLGLEVSSERKDGYLQVNWRHSSPAMQHAMFGNLRIEDGAHQRDVFLDQTELQSGYILYEPESDMVTLRLDVMTPDRGLVVESTRILRPALANTSLPPLPTVSPVRAAVPTGARRTDVRPTRRRAEKEQRRLLIVVANGPPRAVPLEEAHLLASAAPVNGKIPNPPDTAGRLPGYRDPGQQPQNRRGVARVLPPKWRSGAQDQQQSGGKRPFLQRVFQFIRRPWRFGRS